MTVPTISNVSEPSVTRHDAKQITENRLRRLKELDEQPESTLTTTELDEKKRIIRLEKNRRAAAMSRKKRKVYVQNLEKKVQSLENKVSVLEIENSHLRSILNVSQGHLPFLGMGMGMGMGMQFTMGTSHHHMPPSNIVPPPFPIGSNVSQQQYSTDIDINVDHTHQEPIIVISQSNHTYNQCTNTNETNEEDDEPPMKRRRLNKNNDIAKHDMSHNNLGASKKVYLKSETKIEASIEDYWDLDDTTYLQNSANEESFSPLLLPPLPEDEEEWLHSESAQLWL